MMASDGVSKVFVIEANRSGGLDTSGFKNDADAAAHLIFRNWWRVPDLDAFDKYVADFCERIKTAAADLRKEPERDESAEDSD